MTELDDHNAAGASEARSEDNDGRCSECHDNPIETDNDTCAECELDLCDDARAMDANDQHFGLDEDDRSMFADPGGRSALRAATITNPRNIDCPSCGEPNRLTPADAAHGYQCDACADNAEHGGY